MNNSSLANWDGSQTDPRNTQQATSHSQSASVPWRVASVPAPPLLGGHHSRVRDTQPQTAVTESLQARQQTAWGFPQFHLQKFPAHSPTVYRLSDTSSNHPSSSLWGAISVPSPMNAYPTSRATFPNASSSSQLPPHEKPFHSSPNFKPSFAPSANDSGSPIPMSFPVKTPEFPVVGATGKTGNTNDVNTEVESAPRIRPSDPSAPPAFHRTSTYRPNFANPPSRPPPSQTCSYPSIPIIPRPSSKTPPLPEPTGLAAYHNLILSRSPSHLHQSFLASIPYTPTSSPAGSLFSPSPSIPPPHFHPIQNGSSQHSQTLSTPQLSLQLQTQSHPDPPSSPSKKCKRKARLMSHILVPPLPADSSKASYYSATYRSSDEWSKMSSREFLDMLSPENSPRSSPSEKRKRASLSDLHLPSSSPPQSMSTAASKAYVEVRSISSSSSSTKVAKNQSLVDSHASSSPFSTKQKTKAKSKQTFDNVADAYNSANLSAVFHVDHDEEDGSWQRKNSKRARVGENESGGRARKIKVTTANRLDSTALGSSLSKRASTGKPRKQRSDSRSVVDEDSLSRDHSKSRKKSKPLKLGEGENEERGTSGTKRKRRSSAKMIESTMVMDQTSSSLAEALNSSFCSGPAPNAGKDKEGLKSYSYDKSTDVVTLLVKLPDPVSREGSVLRRFWECRDLEQETKQEGILSYHLPPGLEETGVGQLDRTEKSKQLTKLGRIPKQGQTEVGVEQDAIHTSVSVDTQDTRDLSRRISPEDGPVEPAQTLSVDTQDTQDLSRRISPEDEPVEPAQTLSAKALGKRKAIDPLALELFGDGDEEDVDGDTVTPVDGHTPDEMDSRTPEDELMDDYIYYGDEAHHGKPWTKQPPTTDSFFLPQMLGDTSYSVDATPPTVSTTPEEDPEWYNANMDSESGPTSTIGPSHELYELLGITAISQDFLPHQPGHGYDPVISSSDGNHSSTNKLNTNGENNRLDLDHEEGKTPRGAQNSSSSGSLSLSPSSPSSSSLVVPQTATSTSTSPKSSYIEGSKLPPRSKTRFISVQPKRDSSLSSPFTPAQPVSSSNPGVVTPKSLQDLRGYGSSEDEEEEVRDAVGLTATGIMNNSTSEALEVIDVDADGDLDADADASADESGSMISFDMNRLNGRGGKEKETKESAVGFVDPGEKDDSSYHPDEEFDDKAGHDTDTDSDSSYHEPLKAKPPVTSPKSRNELPETESVAEEPEFTISLKNGSDIQWPPSSDEYFCHACRSKHKRVSMVCALYSQKVTFDDTKKDWECFKCQDICKCDHCCKNRNEPYVKQPFPKTIPPVFIGGKRTVLRTNPLAKATGTKQQSKTKATKAKPKPKSKPKPKADFSPLSPSPPIHRRRSQTQPVIRTQKPTGITPIVATEVVTGPLYSWTAVYDFSGRQIAQAFVSEPDHLQMDPPPEVFARPLPKPAEEKEPTPQPSPPPAPRIKLLKQGTSKVFVGDVQSEWELEEGGSIKYKDEGVRASTSTATVTPSAIMEVGQSSSQESSTIRMYVGRRPPKNFLPRPLTPENSVDEDDNNLAIKAPESSVDEDDGNLAIKAPENSVDEDDGNLAIKAPRDDNMDSQPEPTTITPLEIRAEPAPSSKNPEPSMHVDNVFDIGSPLTDLDDDDDDAMNVDGENAAAAGECLKHKRFRANVRSNEQKQDNAGTPPPTTGRRAVKLSRLVFQHVEIRRRSVKGAATNDRQAGAITISASVPAPTMSSPSLGAGVQSQQHFAGHSSGQTTDGQAIRREQQRIGPDSHPDPAQSSSDNTDIPFSLPNSVLAEIIRSALVASGIKAEIQL
ncbi:hypothetical protein K435DRAFT_847583 [Dendrothele bispora CBS 962.96]|uniref:Zinc-finger domain-containing protein n=1 Tax=Dendrothele bispora (strain CBS 962.96) TaxID=1314807 RepID=A0A4S8MX50_DENBC|nr:hypothetical protein K435DRAFT_847583 [Dendrothele bispora CBS 962.96]